MLVRTGAGKFHKERKGSTDLFLLYNFDIDGFEVKQLHKDRLLPELRAVLRPGSRVFMRGLASSTAVPEHNHQLSRRRVREVFDVATPILASSRTINHLDWVGETKMADRPVFEDERFRSVLIAVDRSNSRNVPAPPNITLNLPPVRDERDSVTLRRAPVYRMAVISGVEGPFFLRGTGSAAFYFIIWDVNRSEAAIYEMTAAPTIDLSFPPALIPITIHLGGDFNSFMTSGPVRADEFDGPIEILRGSLLDDSGARVTLTARANNAVGAESITVNNFDMGDSLAQPTAVSGNFASGTLRQKTPRFPYHGKPSASETGADSFLKGRASTGDKGSKILLTGVVFSSRVWS